MTLQLADIQAAQWESAERDAIVLTFRNGSRERITPDDDDVWNTITVGVEDDAAGLVPLVEILPPPPPLETVKREAIGKALAFADAVAARLTKGYPQAEVMSWPRKAEVAARWLEDISQPVPPMIAEEAKLTGQQPRAVAEAVVRRAAFFERVAGIIAGLRQKVVAAIQAASDLTAVEAALNDGLQMAREKLAELGLESIGSGQP